MYRCSLLSIVVGGVGEGFDKEEFTHSNPLGLVLGSTLVESVWRILL